MVVRNEKATGEYVGFLTGFVTQQGALWGPVGATDCRPSRDKTSPSQIRYMNILCSHAFKKPPTKITLRIRALLAHICK